MTEEVKRYLQKAQRSLRVADELLAKGYFDDSCSKSYYVMFYGAQALLKNSGVDVIKHSAVVAKFGEHFVKTAKVDPLFHRHIIDASNRRERGNPTRRVVPSLSRDLIRKVRGNMRSFASLRTTRWVGSPRRSAPRDDSSIDNFGVIRQLGVRSGECYFWGKHAGSEAVLQHCLLQPSVSGIIG